LAAPPYYIAKRPLTTTRDPNKNRGKLFATGELVSNKLLHIEGNDVEELQFWTVYPTAQALKKAKVFLLGRIILILNKGKPCASTENL